jgi:hypothetical protein
MVLSAWEVSSQMQRRSIERAVANALIAATALHQESDEIISAATSITQRIAEPRQRALILSYVGRLLTENDRAEQALPLLLLALESARLAGRDIVMEVLANACATLAAVDNGELLMRIANQVGSIDSWFGAS